MRIVGIIILLTLSTISSASSQVAFLDKGQSGFGTSFKADYIRYDYGRGSAVGTLTAAHIDKGGFEVGLVASTGNRRTSGWGMDHHYSFGAYTEILLMRESGTGFPLTVGLDAQVQDVYIPEGETNYVSLAIGLAFYKRLAISGTKRLVPYVTMGFTKHNKAGGTIGFGLPLAWTLGKSAQLILSPEAYRTSLEKTMKFWTLSFRIAFCTG